MEATDDASAGNAEAYLLPLAKKFAELESRLRDLEAREKKIATQESRIRDLEVVSLKKKFAAKESRLRDLELMMADSESLFIVILGGVTVIVVIGVIFITGLIVMMKGQSIYLGLGVPLFVDNDGKANRVKWGLWIVHKLLLTAIYGLILFMYHSKWRERLPVFRSLQQDLHSTTTRVCLSACGKWIGVWVLVVQYHSHMLPCSISSASVYNIFSRFFPGGRYTYGECVLLRDEGCRLL